MKQSKLLFWAFLAMTLSLSLLAQDDPVGWKFYPYKDPGSQIVFPKDEGRHIGVPNMEWWYSVMHLRGETSGDRYAVLVTHFNNQIRLFTVTNLDKKVHTSGATMGLLNSSFGRLDLTHRTKYGKDIFRTKKDEKGKLIPFEYEIQTHHDKMNLSVQLKSQKRPMMVAGDGYIAVGTSGHTWYYSLTNLAVSGVLEHQGLKEKVTGIGWMDHQWGPFVISPFELGRTFETYEWFCVQLENGMELMISNIFDRDYHLPMTEDYGAVELLYSNGEGRHTERREFKRTGYWRDPVSGHTMSMGWELKVPELNVDIKLTPDLVDQMVQLPMNGSFWEGSVSVTGTIDGVAVKGKAFGELLHRFEKPEVEISTLKSTWKRNETLTLDWKVKNPDDGNPLNFSVSLVQNGVETLLKQDMRVAQFSAKLESILGAQSASKFTLKVRAYSVDKTIKGETETSVLKLIL